MKKTLITAISAMILSAPISAEWSEYHDLASAGKVNLSFRTLDHEDGTGTDVQYKVKNNHNTGREVSLNDKIYHCNDGYMDPHGSITKIIPRKSEFEFAPDLSVCKKHGGLAWLEVSFEVTSRSLQQTLIQNEKIEFHF